MAKKKKNKDTTEPELATEAPEQTADEAEVEIAEEAPLDPIEKLKQEISSANEEARKNWDLYLRERADLENARKRHQREREEAIRFANDRLLKEMIPVLDNLERAVDHADQGS